MSEQDKVDPERRDFVITSTAILGAAGAAAACWPFVSSMNPTSAVKSEAVKEVDLKGVALGAVHTVAWRGEPVFIFHRTPAEVAAMEQSDGGKDPQPDSARVKRPDWLVVIGICTHLGCVPNKTAKGWLCPCHGSIYDNSGRILSGPAPLNLYIPPYHFVSDDKIVIG
jgi:ubiquinol-cytochrome c reductase iron-sulfur subunit